MGCARTSPRVAAPVRILKAPEIPHKAARTMGRVAQLATIATDLAIGDAGLSADESPTARSAPPMAARTARLRPTRTGSASCVSQNGFPGMTATTYLKFMSHTTAGEPAIHFGAHGRVLCTRRRA
ncbi:MAG: hypothetical protein IPQ07_16340 [Myxococcales bacterium]|nr:hypothetical protein [Myxococcales bacterium]